MPPRRPSRARSPSPDQGHSAPRRDRDRGEEGADETSGGHTGSKLAPGLYLVATPIGNLGDLAPRALATLRDADLVLAEDTRVTAALLTAHGARRRLKSYQEHNAARVRPEVLEVLAAGGSVALASDAGTPLVSDPGYKLVREAREHGIAVRAVPGPSAALAALVVSGLPSDRFLVEGFLPPGAGARRRAIAALRTVPATLIVFESARRLGATLADLADLLGPRPAAIARELTKRFEEVRTGRLDRLASEIAAEGPPRGEVVLVVGPPEDDGPEAGDAAVDTALREALAHLPAATAASVVATCSGRPRREVYRRAIALKGHEPPPS